MAEFLDSPARIPLNDGCQVCYGTTTNGNTLVRLLDAEGQIKKDVLLTATANPAAVLKAALNTVKKHNIGGGVLEAKATLYADIHAFKKGMVCKVCDRKVNVLQRELNLRTLQYFFRLVIAYLALPLNLKPHLCGVHMNSLSVGRKGRSGGEYGRFFKLWHFARQLIGLDGNKSALWKPLDRLFDFMSGKIKVPEYYWVYNQKVIGKSPNNISITQALKNQATKKKNPVPRLDLWKEVLNPEKLKKALGEPKDPAQKAAFEKLLDAWTKKKGSP